MKIVDKILSQLADLISRGSYQQLESEGIEIKPVPSTGGDWKQRHIAVNAFLNTRGGILILGVKEEGQGQPRRYVFTGYREDAEAKLKEFATLFTDRPGNPLNLSDCFPPMELRDFMGGRVAIVYVDELSAERKFCFYQGVAYRRSLTGDHKISEADIEAQEDYRREALQAREIRPLPGITPDRIDLDKLNEHIHHLNQPVKVETIKADLASAMPFLTRKQFVINNQMTTLGMLVCGAHPEDALQFRCHVHGYVDVPQEIAQDKQDLINNIIPLMESSVAYVLRNIQVGVSVAQGGSPSLQYPERLIRETTNNALAHRDYTINRQVIIAVKPGAYISIRNPGSFRKNLLIEAPEAAVPLRRIIPEAKPRNPRLANVLRVFRKWEGRGIGMATLVDVCLQNQIDLPYYRFYSEEVELFLCSGKLLDERMEWILQSFDGYLEGKLQGNPLSEPQKLVLAYLIKSEWANEQLRYTIILTPDNNHFNELIPLERAGLITKHPSSPPLYPIYLADRVLLSSNYLEELRQMFGPGLDALAPFLKEILSIVYRFNHFSKAHFVSAKQASFIFWSQKFPEQEGIHQFDVLYRKVRRSFNKLEDSGYIRRHENKPRYELNPEFTKERLL